MSVQAVAAGESSPHEVSVREARLRLVQLVRLIQLGDHVTVLTDETGRPAAALVPAAAARSVAQLRESAACAAASAQQAQARAAASAAGWSRRLEVLREQSARRHAAELQAVSQALAEAWAELDRRCPRAADPALRRLRAAHQQWLPRPRMPADDELR